MKFSVGIMGWVLALVMLVALITSTYVWTRSTSLGQSKNHLWKPGELSKLGIIQNNSLNDGNKTTKHVYAEDASGKMENDGSLLKDDLSVVMSNKDLGQILVEAKLIPENRKLSLVSAAMAKAELIRTQGQIRTLDADVHVHIAKAVEKIERNRIICNILTR